VLEIFGSDSIKSLSAITRLKELRGLVIANQLPDSTRLFDMKQLRYLSIPEEKYTDSLLRQNLQKHYRAASLYLMEVHALGQAGCCC